MKNNPYFIDEPAAISFSGGRTSAYMLYKILEAHGGTLPDYLKVTFANTGKEMPQTLDFVRDCGERWGLDIAWLERYMSLGGEDENKYLYRMEEVDYNSAARNGEPFMSLFSRPYLPNPVARFCTQEMKIFAIRDYMNKHFDEWVNIIGIRADEVRRYHKSNTPKNIMPLYHAGATKETVFDFWEAQEFDLSLPNNNGVTDWGNCDLCFLKGMKKKLSIIRDKPELADWWIEAENRVTDAAGKRSTFRKDEPTYADLKIIATSQDSLFAYGDESISCFCGD